MDDACHLLVVTPLFNEERHLRVVAASLAGQTRPPDAWVAVDDGSTDGTAAILRELQTEIPFLRVVSMPGPRGSVRDGLARAREVDAFNAGVRAAADWRWDLIGKLDGDVELPPDYFERLLERMRDDPRLGMASGCYVEPTRSGRWRRVRVPGHHVPGALKLYTADCLERIGGVPAVLGWDTIDEMYARMHGFQTRSFGDLVARHHRPTGAAGGLLRGRARHGECAWIAHYPAYFVALRSFKEAARRPVGLSGGAFLWGYLRAALRATPRVRDEAFRRHVHGELRNRLRVTT
jgi:glycosyltransferase involved in cell wall biosynthesis